MSQSKITRAVAGIALAGVSLIAAIVSYLHGLQVVRAAGAEPQVAYLIPFLADLVILGASASWVEASKQNRRVPALTIVTAGVGIGVTLAMNVAAGWDHGAGGRLVAGWPAVAFILALESLAGIVRRGRGGGTGALSPATVIEAGPDGTRDMLQRMVDASSQRKVAEQLGISRPRLVKLLSAPASMNGDGPHE